MTHPRATPLPYRQSASTPRSQHNLSSKQQQQQQHPHASPAEMDDDNDGESSSTMSNHKRPTQHRIVFAPESLGGQDDTESAEDDEGDEGQSDQAKKQQTATSQDAGLSHPSRNGGTALNQYHHHDDDGEEEEEEGERVASKEALKNKVRQNMRTTRRTRRRTRQSNDATSWKRRKRGRRVRVVQVSSPLTTKTTSTNPTGMLLPRNQYSTVLRRRAIRKLEDASGPSSDPDIYGDISLGMKLIVAGGKVIVQNLNALADGRASPAQLVGVIQRGDVLLAVEDLSLVHLPIDQLMDGLKPLSSPENDAAGDARYRRTLRLRFEAGVGLGLLQSHERGLASASSTAAGAMVVQDTMFALFPMVDQLSGAPLIFDSSPTTLTYSYSKEEAHAEDGDLPKDQGASEPEDLGNDSRFHDESSSTHDKISPYESISAVLAQQHALDRQRFSSEFFDWSERFSELLKGTPAEHPTVDYHTPGAGLTKSERIALGQKVMNVAKSLTYTIEDIDKGKDLRSFKTWSANFSLRSGASARRRHIMDAASLRSHRHHKDHRISESTEMDEDSVGSAGSGSFGSVDGDALLLGLAAHDDIWRKQVISSLRKSIEKMENGQDMSDEEEGREKKVSNQVTDDINAALSNELGAFLFGENMNSFIKKEKKSYALPPEDITTVLFDLTTHITTAAPDQVTTVFAGGTVNSVSFPSKSSLGTQSKAKAQLRTDIMLANRFILDEVLPVWLETFRPLGLDQRRLFWPKIRRGSAGSHGGTSSLFSDNDSLTVDSSGSVTKASGGHGTKNLQEMIEDLELDVETRAETCFLVTYYFTQQILSKYSSCPSESDMEPINDEVATFAQRFGTYLQIHSCLAFSARVEADKAVDELLAVAQFDPSHRDALKEIQIAKDLTFYDASMLSALLELLHKVRYETNQRQKVLQSLCVAAYPDVQPWQVKRACFDPRLHDDSKNACSDDSMRDFYYSYLSHLLDPVDGQDIARRNVKLVKEWCKWSIGVNNGDVQKIDQDRLKNFYRVVSRTSSAHLAYSRDLPTLLEMSMAIKEYNLALELTTEIIEDRKLCGRAKTISRVLVCLREIGMEGLALAWKAKQDGIGFHTLKRVLRAFQQMSTSQFQSCRECINVPVELLTLLEEWQRNTLSKDSATSDLLILIDFMIIEAAPIDVLSALLLWSSSNELGSALFSRLDSLLRRGVQVALKSELSGSLLRLKYIRRGYTQENRSLISSQERNEAKHEGSGIWKRMSLGTLSIDK